MILEENSYSLKIRRNIYCYSFRDVKKSTTDLKQAFDDLHKMESIYNILKKRIGSLVNGELARKVLESNQKWMAKLKIMQYRIDRLNKNLEKESKVLGLRSWNYARY